jgi:hypothetical protein
MTSVGLVEWSLSDFASGGTGWATKIAVGLTGVVIAVLVIKFLLQSIKTALKIFLAFVILALVALGGCYYFFKSRIGGEDGSAPARQSVQEATPAQKRTK